MARKTKGMLAQSKLMYAERASSVQCKCSNRIPIKNFRGKEYGVCYWCGGRVYKDREKQKEYDEQLKKERFEKELKKYLKVSSQNEIDKRGKRNTRKN